MYLASPPPIDIPSHPLLPCFFVPFHLTTLHFHVYISLAILVHGLTGHYLQCCIPSSHTEHFNNKGRRPISSSWCLPPPPFSRYLMCLSMAMGPINCQSDQLQSFSVAMMAPRQAPGRQLASSDTHTTRFLTVWLERTPAFLLLNRLT